MLASQCNQASFRKVSRQGASRPQRVALRCEAASKAKFLVGGNWKSNGTKASVKQLVDGLNAGASSFDPKNVDVVVAPTFVHLDYVQQNLSSNYKVSSQNVWLTGPGAYTGEIVAEQLKDLGLNWVITGHSERRSLCGETNEIVAKKTVRALDQGFSVIACIGETLEQRKSGQMFPILDAQVQALIDNIKDWSSVVVAYEPVWAIGTGVVASPQQAQEVHAHLRELLETKLGKETAQTIRILYGGSVNDKNSKELASLEDVDGFLVGGASLQAPAFLTIIGAHAVKAK